MIISLVSLFTLMVFWRIEIKKSFIRIDDTVAKIPKVFGKIAKVLISVGLVLATLYLLTSVFVDLQLNTSFEQRLTVLAPHISEQEYMEIKATWSSMETRLDYETIHERMETLAEQNSIKLPESLLK